MDKPNMGEGWRQPPDYMRVDSAVEGITVYAPKPKEDASVAPRAYICPNCGATTRYDVAEGGVACEHCGYAAAVETEQVGRQAEEFEFTLDTLQSEKGLGQDRRTLTCEQCGAVLSVQPMRSQLRVLSAHPIKSLSAKALSMNSNPSF